MSRQFRCPPRSILAGLLGDAPKIIGLVVILLLGSSASGDTPGLLFWVAQAALALQVLARPIEWLSNSYRFIDGGIEHRSGILKRSVKSLPWDAVTAVDVTQNWSARLLGVHHVHLAQEGSPFSGITLRGAEAETVAEIRALKRHTGHSTPAVAQEMVDGETAAAETTEAEHPPASQSILIHRAGLKELLFISLVRGQAFLLGAGALYSLWEFLDNIPFVTEHLSSAGGVPSWGKVLLLSVFTVIFGVMSTVVKYNDFHVRIEDGQLVTSFGLIERKDRRFAPESVMGLVIQRNLLERFLGRARLGVLTRDREAELEVNTVLPTLPTCTVEAVAREHFPEVMPTGSLVEPWSRAWVALAKLLLLAGILAGVAGLLWVIKPQAWVVVLALVAAWVLPLSLLSRAFTGFHLDDNGRVVVVRRSLVGEKTTTVRTRCVHAVGNTLVAGRMLGAWFSTYAGSPERYWGLQITPADLERLRSRLLRGAESVGGPCLNGPRD
ncbi:MAG: PH domain-containing protein [Propionibacteriaceae bacterium]|nr:PH domain-containing protein [Propionibacteriaceae bacterium]